LHAFAYCCISFRHARLEYQEKDVCSASGTGHGVVGVFKKSKKKAASAEQGPQTSVMSAGLRTAKKYSGQVTRRNEEKPKTPRSM
jgi:hypothetical protein